MFPERLAHHWPDGEIRHVMIVHDVEMNDIRTCSQHAFDLFSQAGEVSG